MRVPVISAALLRTGLGVQMLLDPLKRLPLDGGIVPEAQEPLDASVPAKPGELAFSVVAVPLLRFSDSLRQRHGPAQNGKRLGIAKRAQRAGVVPILRCDGGGLFEQALREHSGSASVNTVVKRGAGWVQTELQQPEASQGIAAGAPLLRLRLAAEQRDLKTADELGLVVRVNGGCGLRIEASKDAVQGRGTATCGVSAEAVAKSFVAWGSGRQTVEQRAEVQACAAGDDRQAATAANLAESGATGAGVVSGGGRLVRVKQIEAMVRDPRALGEGRLGGADVHTAVHGDGVAGEDFAVALLLQPERKGRLATGSWTCDDNQGLGVLRVWRGIRLSIHRQAQDWATTGATSPKRRHALPRHAR